VKGILATLLTQVVVDLVQRAMGENRPFGSLLVLSSVYCVYIGGLPLGLASVGLDVAFLAAMYSFGPSAVRLTSLDVVHLAVLLVADAGGALLTWVLKRRAERALLRVHDIELKVSRDDLARSEDRFRLLVESVHEYAIFMLDPGGRVMTWNFGASRITGYAAEEVIGRGFEMFFPPAEQRAGRPARELEESVSSGRFECEGWRIRRDGSRFWSSSLLTALRDSSGRLLGFAKIIRDLTDRKRAEDDLRAAHDRLEQVVQERTAQLQDANRELEAFCYSISHDLRAPLRSIDGFNKALLEDFADRIEPEARHYLDRSCAAAGRMARLIDDLLNLSRLSRADLRPAPFDLSRMAEDILGELRAAEPERAVETRVAPGLAARGDARLMRAALGNLLGNAWKFTSRQEAPRIEFGACNGPGPQAYFVRDNGAGFDMAYAGKLFGAFQRLHSTTEFPGTGVGLTTVQRIIHRHGGRVWAEAAPGRGATFYFTLEPPGGSHEQAADPAG
jgi:PAS domain S-box-containing protein